MQGWAWPKSFHEIFAFVITCTLQLACKFTCGAERRGILNHIHDLRRASKKVFTFSGPTTRRWGRPLRKKNFFLELLKTIPPKNVATKLEGLGEGKALVAGPLK